MLHDAVEGVAHGSKRRKVSRLLKLQHDLEEAVRVKAQDVTGLGSMVQLQLYGGRLAGLHLRAPVGAVAL